MNNKCTEKIVSENELYYSVSLSLWFRKTITKLTASTNQANTKHGTIIYFKQIKSLSWTFKLLPVNISFGKLILDDSKLISPAKLWNQFIEKGSFSTPQESSYEKERYFFYVTCLIHSLTTSAEGISPCDFNL